MRYKKFIITLTILMFVGFKSFGWYDIWGRKHYFLSVGITNPLSGMSKIGGTLEFRKGQSSYLVGYTDYLGVYAGKQASFQYYKYLYSRTTREFFIYFKGVAGDASFDSKKLAIAPIGDVSKIFIGPNAYGGAGAGFGKRYHHRALFLAWNFGIKYCALNPMPVEEKNMYRLFYVTGPGSMIEFNFKGGIQL